MDDAIPVIMTGRSLPRREPAWARGVALAIGLGCLAVLLRAATLPPSASGLGTHTAMGLNRCTFIDRTGLPCPSCGMTTSFAWFARGNLAASLYVQPMGALLALAAAMCVWGGLYIAFTGRPVYRLLRVLPGRYFLMPAMGLAVLAWAWKIFLQINRLDGWG